MLKNYKVFLLLLIVVNFSLAQELALKGKITSSSDDLESIYILNLRNKNSTLSQKGGYFEINASVNDTLQFSAVQFKGLKVKLKAEDFTASLFFVKLELAIYQVKEVVVAENKEINAVSLGIISKPAKKYSVAERRLRTAGELHWYSPLLIPVGGMSIDGMLNAINGKTAMLKKELIVEKKEKLIKKSNDWFNEIYFTETLKIPADYVKGFQYYLAESKEFEAAVAAKNKTLATFVLTEVAVKYLEIINENTTFEK